MADLQLIDYLCKLAKLSFDDKEKEQMAQDMQEIMALMDTIGEVDIKAEDYPLEFPGKFDGLRADEIRPSLLEEEALANVPNRKYKFVAVKKIME